MVGDGWRNNIQGITETFVRYLNTRPMSLQARSRTVLTTVLSCVSERLVLSWHRPSVCGPSQLR